MPDFVSARSSGLEHLSFARPPLQEPSDISERSRYDADIASIVRLIELRLEHPRHGLGEAGDLTGVKLGCRLDDVPQGRDTEALVFIRVVGHSVGAFLGLEGLMLVTAQARTEMAGDATLVDEGSQAQLLFDPESFFIARY